MEKGPYIILGYRPPSPFNNLKMGVAASTLGYFCGWTGNGWGKERDTDSEAEVDALPYADEEEVVVARQMARVEASIKDTRMHVMVMRTVEGCEDLPLATK